MIIKSMMDTDWYIFTMAQLFLHKHPTAIGRDAFKCRNAKETLFADDKPSFKTMPELVDRLNDEISHYCTLMFDSTELNWLSKSSYLKPDYIDWLEDFRPKRRYINVIKKTDGTFDIDINGPITQQIWFEVPTLSMVSEIYGEVAIDKEMALKNGRARIRQNAEIINPVHTGISIADFGTRRRYSQAWHEEAFLSYKELLGDVLVGTSNAYLAMRHGYTPIGTMAHKALCAYQALVRIIDSQKVFFQDWADEYRGELGIALSDNFGFVQFLKDFDKYFAKLFDGARHDSGDPLEWGHSLYDHYMSLKIDPRSKTAVFSDGLNFSTAVGILTHFAHKYGMERFLMSFGIGTKFSNDMGFLPASIVIKLIECNGSPVAKIADDPGKGMCQSQSYVNYVHSILPGD